MRWWLEAFLAMRLIILGAGLFLIGSLLAWVIWGRDNEIVAIGVVISFAGLSILAIGVVMWPRTRDARSATSKSTPVPLTKDGREVFFAAIDAALRGGHEYIGTEHLLIGMASAGPSPALEALERAGISPEAIRRVCTSPPMTGKVVGILPLTPAVRRVFASALGDAKKIGDSQVDSLGLLLALARDETGVARELLAKLIGRELLTNECVSQLSDAPNRH
jgi:hypothetical protein